MTTIRYSCTRIRNTYFWVEISGGSGGNVSFCGAIIKKVLSSHVLRDGILISCAIHRKAHTLLHLKMQYKCRSALILAFSNLTQARIQDQYCSSVGLTR